MSERPIDEVAELRTDLRLNASMLARQTDLARQAEIERDEAGRRAERAVGALAEIVSSLDFDKADWAIHFEEIPSKVHALKVRAEQAEQGRNLLALALKQAEAKCTELSATCERLERECSELRGRCEQSEAALRLAGERVAALDKPS